MTSKNKTLSNREKQFTILPNETEPEKAFSVAKMAANKAVSEINRTKKAR